jgi:hypothetical protein
MEEKGFASGVALGLLLGTFGSIAMFWILWPDDVLDDGMKQTIVMFSAAIAASGLALWGIQHQITIARNDLAKERLRKLLAARATLPIVLSEIHNICKERIKQITNPLPASRIGPWPISQPHIDTLKACIELSNGSVRENLEDICRVYQAACARWVDLERNILTKYLDFGEATEYDQHEATLAIIDWQVMSEIAGVIFPFSRGKSENVDRLSVREKSLVSLNLLTDANGFFLVDSRIYKIMLDIRATKESFSFTSLDWLDG